MVQNTFYSNIVDILVKCARQKEPVVLATRVYAYIREHPDNITKPNAWETILKNLRVMLSEHFEWEMPEIHSFFIEFNILTKYMKKSS